MSSKKIIQIFIVRSAFDICYDVTTKIAMKAKKNVNRIVGNFVTSSFVSLIMVYMHTSH